MQPSNDPTTPMDTRDDDESRRKVHALIAKAVTAMFGTYDARGNNHSRPMVAIDHEGDDLWFFARSDSRKVAELSSDPRVSLHYADDSGKNYVSVVGTAEIVRDADKAKELWMEPLRTWFPDGAEDPHVTLIRVAMDTAEYWDSSSGAKIFAYGYLKARLTGTPPSPGDVRHVDM